MTKKATVPSTALSDIGIGDGFEAKVRPGDEDRIAIDWDAPLDHADADPAARLERLEDLRRRGLIDGEEYEAQRKRIIGSVEIESGGPGPTRCAPGLIDCARDGLRRGPGRRGDEGAARPEIGPSEWRPVSQEDIDTFAGLSGDHQWIHVDAERAKAESPYGTTIAHGNLTFAMVDGFRDQLISSTGFALGVNYG